MNYVKTDYVKIKRYGRIWKLHPTIRYHPAAIAIVAFVGFQSYAAYEAGKDAKEQAKVQAAIAEQNAKIEKQKAEALRRQRDFAVQQHRRKANIILSAMRAQYGKSGVAMEGSPLLVMEDTANQLNLEIANIYATGEAGARAHEQQSIMDITTAKAYRERGKRAYTAGLLSAGSELAGGYLKYKTYDKLGLLS